MLRGGRDVLESGTGSDSGGGVGKRGKGGWRVGVMMVMVVRRGRQLLGS